ncbi:NAD(P)/FAD-dependent oxidoreductase [Kangiella sp. TOML190]|uniref:NAD(P)/FAD-dependent oxidoreductase n=1 Tax=Kangiella sp. TOML190 TaxID=2931351 RepID=UPI00203D4D85|nr:FAD-dependent oxidoreductase [Kangiella sp. TOML190]
MKVAIIGSGISGIAAAEKLYQHCDVTIFEKNEKVGGHADTQTIFVDDKTLKVDTGFIVFNPENYPTFFTLLKKYQVAYQDSDMSFAVTNRMNGLEYNASSLDQLFCQRKNLISPKFYRMIWDIFRFYREAKELLDSDMQINLGEYLKKKRYSQYFIDEHLIPMASALWSGDSSAIMQFPASYLVAFMNNHRMLQAFNRPVWKTIQGGSETYLNSILESISIKLKLNSAISSVERHHAGVRIITNSDAYDFDKVIFASHSDQTLKMIADPTHDEKWLLGNIGYQENTMQLHTDTKVLPKNKKAWASWNMLNDERTSKACRVSYYMNLLQSLNTQTPIIVSLNMQDKVNKGKILKEIIYHHPIYNQAAIEAQKQKHLIQGGQHSYYCGAYWGWGFHEDGALSGIEAAKALLKDINCYDSESFNA